MGADQVSTGLQTFITGQPQHTVGARAIAELTGLNVDVAELDYGIISAGLSVATLPTSSMPEIAGSQLGKTQTASGLTQEVIDAGENEATVVAKSESATQQAGMLAKEESTAGTDLALTGEKTATNVEEGVVANSKASAVAGEDSSATEQLAQVCTGTACFIAGTLVETVHGLRPIEMLGLGDWVWSRQEFGQDYDYRPVVATKATPDQPIYEVVVTNAQGEQETFYTTEEHPFYVEGLGWRKTTALEAGMPLLDRQGNSTLTVISQQTTDRKETVYNIKVQDFSTYHIGQLGVWVHNADCCDMRLPVPNAVKTKFGVYKSNAKHTAGTIGNHSKAGIEPRNSLDLFEDSVYIKGKARTRYAQDSDGNIHRFSSNKDETEWHWSGSTGDKNPLKLKGDIKKALRNSGFKIPLKGNKM